MTWEILVDSKIVADIGWTLLHSLWQIALVSAVLFLILRLLRNQAANVRYAVCLCALAVSVILPAFTFVQISAHPWIGSASRQIDSVARGGIKGEPIYNADPTSGKSVDGVADMVGGSFLSTVRTASSRYVSDVLPFAVFVWLLGVAFFSLRLGGGFLQLRCYRDEETTDVDEYWHAKFYSLCVRTGVSQKVRLLQSALVKTPIAIGVFKPLILVPACLFLQITPRELETVIAHELIHIRRYDPLVNVLQHVAETLLFYHPAAWWISARIRREREFAADAAVMATFEDSHVVYARALANLEEIRLRTNKQAPRYAMAANGGNLMQRIQRILKIKTEASSANSAWTAGLAVLLTSAVLLAIFSFNSSSYVNAQGKSTGRKLAIGFVSIPPLDRTANAPKDADATARLLIDALKRYKVPATGFLQGGMISDGENFLPARRDIARMWIDAGFEVGLGGFKHLKLYNTPIDDYIANIEKNERVAKKLLGDMGSPPRYFSYPYLNAGRSAEDKSKVEAWLNQRGYTSVKYTFDNQEWMYSFAYDMARNDNDVNTMKEIREAYLKYMAAMFDHYEAYSREMFGREIAQTMVLTPSRLITDTADEFFAMTAKRGYSYITVDEAQSDPAYKTQENSAGEAGISWFERWRMAKGEKLLDEPAVNGTVWRMWETRGKK